MINFEHLNQSGMLLKWIANIRISPDPVTVALFVTLPALVLAVLADPIVTFPPLVVAVLSDPLLSPFVDPFELELFPSENAVPFLI